MVKRFLDCNASDFAGCSKQDLLTAIAGSEGRTLLCETIGMAMPILGDVTNAELAASMGADILLLNLFDVNKPVINALPKVAPQDTIREIKILTGRPAGINLEPAPSVKNDGTQQEVWSLTEGRR